MTKRNKRSKIIPIIIIKPSQSGSFVETKCDCGENVEQGKVNCNRFPECCDNDLVLVELPDYEGLEFV
jgi:hypothetical protein